MARVVVALRVRSVSQSRYVSKRLAFVFSAASAVRVVACEEEPCSGSS